MPPKETDDLLELNEEQPDLLEEDDDDFNVNDVGTKAYIPPDDIDLSTGVTSTNQGPAPSRSARPAPQPNVINTNFEGGMLSLNHYKRYFNINTTEFFSNVFNSINILNKVENEEDLGDMYGPLWVTATVIFILFFSNTCSGLLVNWLIGGETSYQYNFNLLTGAISLLYGYTFLIPTIFHLISVYYFKMTSTLPLSKLISIYGYANSVWVPAAILSILRGFLANHFVLSSILKWVSVLVGGLVSGASILSKLFPVVRNSALVLGNEKLGFILCGLLALAHIGFIIAVKVSFFGDLNVV